MKMLFGLYHPDEGEILIKGEPVQLRNPGDAIARGIGMVHQHFLLVPVFTVAENIMLGAETHSGPLLDTATASPRIRELSTQYGLTVDPTPLVADLPVGTQQRVEIVKALYREADILILDEPTAVLTPQEADELLKVMRDLAASGTSIIFITHKLHEVMAVRRPDRRAARRQGRRHRDAARPRERVAGRHDGRPQRRAAGREGRGPPGRGGARRQRPGGQRRPRRTRPSTASTCRCAAGEILGIAGVEGNGQRELVEALCGMRRRAAGTVSWWTATSRTTTPRAINRLGVAHIPEDRQKHGLVGTYSVADNLVLERFDEAPFARGHRARLRRRARRRRRLVERVRRAHARNIHNRCSRSRAATSRR